VLISPLSDIAVGLQQLHAIGIIHRDLKPANVLQHEGRWKLADFGIAQDEEIGTQNPTFVGWGSPAYLVPELWEAGRPMARPTCTRSAAPGWRYIAVHRHMRGISRPSGPLTCRRTVPAVPTANVTQANLIALLLAKNPGDRPQDARAWSNGSSVPCCRAALFRRPSRAASPNTPPSGHGRRQRRPWRRRAKEAANRLLAQAVADLKEIVTDAHEELLYVEGDTRLELDQGGWLITMSAPDASLRINVWSADGGDPVPGDAMAAAAEVVISIIRYPRGLNGLPAVERGRVVTQGGSWPC